MNPVWPIPRIEYKPFRKVREESEVALITTGPAWEAVKDKLEGLPVAWRADVREADEEVWAKQFADIRGEQVFAVGGGLAVDAAKYAAATNDLPLTCLPTALSVDAFLTWASGVRKEGGVYYFVTQCPDRLIIDFEVIASAPRSVFAAGICDVLSIATGNWDWKYAEEKGKNHADAPWVSYASKVADNLLQGALDCAGAAGEGKPEGLKQLLETLAMEVQLCNLIGHSRPEEGSEHYFAYSVENEMGKGLPHGDLVGPGIAVMAHLQGQDTKPLVQALRECHIPLANIPLDVARRTLETLPDYCLRHNLAHGIAHDLTPDMVEEGCHFLRGLS